MQNPSETGEDFNVIGGDFNVIRFPSERIREGRILGDMRNFSQVIDDLELKDFPLGGGCFTWRGGLTNQREAMLDHFLDTEDWDAHFGEVVQSLLQRPVSDHFPIILEGGGSLTRGPTPFRFENMWIKEEGFKDLIRVWWQSLSSNGTKSFILSEKIKALKFKIKTWNREVFGKVEVSKKVALARVALWDDLEGQRSLNIEEQEERANAKADYKKWSIMEETS